MRTKPKASTGRGGFEVVAVVDAEQVRRIVAALRSVPEKSRKGIFAKSFRKWGRSVVASAKALAPRRTGMLRKSIGVRIRRYRRAVWAAVGGTIRDKSKIGIWKAAKLRQTLGRDYLGAGWRLHLAERGFTPGGTIRRGKRQGISTKAKSRVAGRSFIFNAGNAHASRLPDLVQDAVDAAIRGEGLR
jgi:hypothetical protein